MQADHVFRPFGGGGDLVDIQGGGIGRKDGAGLGDGVELGEQFLLYRHILEHRFDDDVGSGEVGEIEAGGQQRHAGGDVLGGDPALLGAVFVISANGRHAAIERFLRGLDNHGGNTRIGKVHRDATAHGAGADDAGEIDLAARGVARHVGDLVGLALGKEEMTERSGLAGVEQFREQLTFAAHTALEVHFGGGLDCRDAGLRRHQVALGLGVALACDMEAFRAARCFNQQAVAVADPGQELRLGLNIVGEVERGLAQVALDDLVDDAHFAGLTGADRLARANHLDRLLDADNPWQTLGAAGAGQDAELHLGQAEFGAGHRQSVVASESSLKPAAKGSAVDCGNDRLGAGLHHLMHLAQGRRNRRLAKFRDVGASEEGAPGADQHNCIGVFVGNRPFDAFLQAGANSVPQGVNRWVVHGQNGNPVFNRIMHKIAHPSPLWLGTDVPHH